MTPDKITATAIRIAASHARSPATPDGYGRLAADLSAATGCIVACQQGEGHDVRVRVVLPRGGAFDLRLPGHSVSSPVTAQRPCFFCGGHGAALIPGDPRHLPELICDRCGGPA
jgi:hypothetical protein